MVGTVLVERKYRWSSAGPELELVLVHMRTTPGYIRKLKPSSLPVRCQGR